MFSKYSTKFIESEVMLELEMESRAKGEFAPNVSEVIKSSKIANKKIQELEPSGNLINDVVHLAKALCEKGFVSEAAELENNVFAYKLAASDLYKEIETGDELLESAHPEGDVAIADKAMDDGHVVETLGTRHKKMVEVATKAPKISASSKMLLLAVEEVFGLKKNAQVSSSYSAAQQEEAQKYVQNGAPPDQALRAVMEFTPEQKQQLMKVLNSFTGHLKGSGWKTAVESALEGETWDEFLKGFSLKSKDTIDNENKERAKIGLPPLPGGSESIQIAGLINYDIAKKAVMFFDMVESAYTDLLKYLEAIAKAGDQIAYKRSIATKYILDLATFYSNTISDAIKNKNTINDLKEKLNGKITFNDENDLVSWAEKFKNDTIAEYKRVLNDNGTYKNPNSNPTKTSSLLKKADQGAISLDTEPVQLPGPKTPEPVSTQVTTKPSTSTQISKPQDPVNDEVKRSVIAMQDLLHDFGIQILKNSEQFKDMHWKELASSLMHTGVGSAGQAHSGDGKWGNNTYNALTAFNVIANEKNLPTVDVGPYLGKPVYAKDVVSAADSNVNKIVSAMKSLSFSVPENVKTKTDKDIGNKLDTLPNSIGRDIVTNIDESTGTIPLYSKNIGSLNDLYSFLTGNGLIAPSENSSGQDEITNPWEQKELFGEGLTVNQWDSIFRNLYNRAQRQMAAGVKANDNNIQTIKRTYIGIIASLYKAYQQIKNNVLKNGGNNNSVVPMNDLGNEPSQKDHNNNFQHASYRTQNENNSEGFDGSRGENNENLETLPISDFINLHELSRYARINDKFEDIRVSDLPLRSIDRISKRDLMALMNTLFPTRIGMGKLNWESVAYQFLNDLSTAITAAYEQWRRRFQDAPDKQVRAYNSIVNRWTVACQDLLQMLSGPA